MAVLRRILVVNAGSTSLKLSAVDEAEQEKPVAALEAAPEDVDAVGHRVVHGGPRFGDAVMIDDEVERELAELAELAPLHTKGAIAAIDAAASVSSVGTSPQQASTTSGSAPSSFDAQSQIPIPRVQWTTASSIAR